MKNSLEELSKKCKIPWLSKFYIGIGTTIVILLFFAVYSMSENNYHLSFYSIPLFIGLLFETKRLAESWEIVILKVIGALIAGLLISLYYTGTSTHTETDQILTNWPITFIGIYIIISYMFYDKKITIKLTEGITLLQSFAIIYYVISTFKAIEISYITGTGLIIFSGFAIFSIYNAFTYKELTREARLFLSIWSSLIMLFFASIFIYKMYELFNVPINDMEKVSTNSIHYFLLGVSAIYIVQNLLMLTVYTPNRDHFYGKEHMTKIRKVNEKHISRYSENQVRKSDSILCLIFCLVIYLLNFFFNIVPKQTAIWITFVTFPLLVELKNKITL